MMTLRVAVITPFGAPSVRGNAITVERIARGLSEQALDVRVWDLSVTSEATVEAEVAAFHPLLAHAFHAYGAGPLALRLARRAETPLVVTITGTDANHDLFDPERAAVVRRVLEGATSVVVFHDSIRRRIAGVLPDVDPRIVVIPQGVQLPRGDPFDLARWWPSPPERTLFLFPAGIRMVKRPLLPLAPLERLAARRPAVRLLFVGPILDPEEGETLFRALRTRPWARHAGAQPHERMWSLLEAADVVINASISEGGMANSVLEAMAAGRPVLASDIDGNRSLVEHGLTGFLFRTEDELETYAERLVDDPTLRRRLGEAGRLRLEQLSPPGREVGSYAALYRGLLPVYRR